MVDIFDRKGAWVSIFGRINIYQGRRTITVFHVAPITDFNDLTLHFTECIYSHLLNTTAAKSQNPMQMDEKSQNPMQMDAKSQNPMQLDAKNQNPMQMEAKNQNQWSQPQQGQQQQGGVWNNQQQQQGGGGGVSNTLQNKILNIIRAPEFEESETGCDVQVLFDRLSGEDVNAMRLAIDLLMNNGMIYSTVDDEHYKFSGDGN